MARRDRLILLLLFALAVLVAVPADVSAICLWRPWDMPPDPEFRPPRPPSGEVPPNMRDPEDPPPTGGTTGGEAPTGGDTSGETPTGGDDAGETPTGGDSEDPPPPGGDAGDPAGTGGDETGETPTPPSRGAPPPRGPAGPGRAGGASVGTPGRAPRAASRKENGANWQTWWLHNEGRFLERGRTTNLGGRTAEDATAREEFWREAAIDALLLTLGDRQIDPSTSAAIALGKAGDAACVPRLAELLLAPGTERSLRESLALALGLIGGEEARGAIVTVLTRTTEPRQLRTFAAVSLGLTRAREAIPVLASHARLDAEAHDVRAAALIGVGLIGERLATPLLADRAADEEADRLERAAAVHAIGMLGDREALETVIRLTQADPVEVRRAAVLALGRLTAPTDRNALRALMLAVTKESDQLARCYATVALGRTGAPRAIEFLGEVVDHPNAALRGFGALGLGLLGRRNDDEAVRDRISKFLRTRLTRRGTSSNTRAALATALGILGDEAARPLLTKLLADEDPLLRGHAAVSLALIGSRGVLPDLRRMLVKERDLWLIDRVATALAVLADSPASTVLDEMARDGAGEYQRAIAALALGRVGGPNSVRTLIGLVSGKGSSLVRSTASEALGRRLENRPLRAFFALSEDFDYMLRLPAFHVLLSIF